MQTVALIIEHLGGTSKVAADINLPLTTVHSWERANSVPEWRRPALIALAKKRRKPLTLSDFPPASARVSLRTPIKPKAKEGVGAR